MPERLVASAKAPQKHKLMTLQEMQRQYVREVVESVGNKVQAAEVLGIGRSTLYRILEGADEGAELSSMKASGGSGGAS